MQIGEMAMEHRVVMAPLTRLRADASGVMLPIAEEYYTQRSSVPGTLIISEACIIAPAHGGSAHMPGIWSNAQIESWKKITKAVHARGCRMICQLIALGRAAKVELLEKDGYKLLGPSPIPMNADRRAPNEMTEEEIAVVVQDYEQAAKNAIVAGFDGIEIHGANGYLADQFLQDGSNQRTDNWGGSVENRSRFPVTVATAVANAVGANRVGFRVSPWSNFQSMRMADPVTQFSHLASQLKELNLAYLHAIESRVNNWEDVEKVEGIDFLLEIWGKEAPVLVAGGFNPETAQRAVDEEYKNYNVAVVFGRHFLANPDLPFRLKEGLPLNKYSRETFYTPMITAGYIDYPFSPQFVQSTNI
jgi:NADPH2 dehydrogenase